MDKKITLRDVAKEANVSVATASYVLNNVQNQTITAETRERVLKAVDKLNYVQNLTARSLSLGKSNLLGVLLVGDKSDLISKYINYGTFIDQLERLSIRRNYHLMVSRIDPRQPDFAIIAERKLDGVFLIDPCESSFYTISENFQFGSPLILIDGLIDDPLFDNVVIDFDQLFTIINDFYSGDRSYAIVHEKYSNASMARELKLASGVNENRIFSATDDTELLRSFVEQNGDRPFVIFNEFLALFLMKFLDPTNMLVICTSDCAEYLPKNTRRIILNESKSQIASEMMDRLLKDPFGSKLHSNKLTFHLSS